jgi:hypothetical protein
MKAADFTAESGIPLSYIIIVNEDADGDPPTASLARTYASVTGVDQLFPVTVDPTVQQVLDQTPWTGDARPGKCVLSPEMVMLACYDGDDDAIGFEAIIADAAR